MRILFYMMLAIFIIQSAALAGDGLTGFTGDGDQFGRAMLDVIAAAAREGKKITVKRMDYAPEEGGLMIGPSPVRTPATSVIVVDIRNPDAVEEPSQRLLLSNQEEIMQALNVICEGQLQSGVKLSGIAGLGAELGQTMRGMSDDVDRVNEGVSATYSEVGDVSEVSRDTAVTLEGIKKELKKLNQTVQSLLSSMGEIDDEISSLASSTAEGAEDGDRDEGVEADSSSAGNSGGSSHGEGEYEGEIEQSQ